MRSIYIVILLVLVFSHTKSNETDITHCYETCYSMSNCEKDDICQIQLGSCQNVCNEYDRPEQQLSCYKDCLESQYSEHLAKSTFAFIQCGDQCISGHVRANKNQQQKSPIQQLRQKIRNDPFSHPGTTLEEIDCSKLKSKKNIFIYKGNPPHITINHYFKSRCDFQITLSKNLNSINYNDYNFIWTDYHHQQRYDQFIEGKNIVNHIPNLRSLISDKDGFYLTMKEYDQKRVYDFNSTSFHFRNFIFDLSTPKILPGEEQTFFNDVKDGYWLAKDPDGSLGKGIHLFRGTEEIKKSILKLKNTENHLVDKKSREVAKFSVIQEYLHNPLLMGGKKFDLRIFVLIASVKPFVVLYQPGFIRKCIAKYDLYFEEFSQNEAYKHLTNRIYQKNHPKYEQEKEFLMITPPQYEEVIKKEYNLSQQELDKIHLKNKKITAYSIASAREKLLKKQGYFQLMGMDIIYDINNIIHVYYNINNTYDDQFNPYLIEFNTSAGMYTETKGHLYVIPQLAQSTLDLILKTHNDMNKLWKVWENPEKLDLGRFEILYNEATGYDILEEHKIQQQDNKQDL